MDEDDDYEETTYQDSDVEIGARRMTGIDLVIAVWALLATCAENLNLFFEHVTRLLVGHRNYLTEQREFADEIRAEIESIPTQED